jgi:hypothetical protein
MDVCLFGMSWFSGRGLCDRPMHCPEESYWVNMYQRLWGGATTLCSYNEYAEIGKIKKEEKEITSNSNTMNILSFKN